MSRGRTCRPRRANGAHPLRRDQQELFRFLALGEGPPDEETLATADCRVLATLDAVDSTVILAEVSREERRPGEPFTADDIVWDDALRAV